MRIMLRDFDDKPIIYLANRCSVDENPDAFFFTTQSGNYKIVFNEGYTVNLQNIMNCILQDGYYSFYRMSEYKVYYYCEKINQWKDVKEIY